MVRRWSGSNREGAAIWEGRARRWLGNDRGGAADRMCGAPPGRRDPRPGGASHPAGDLARAPTELQSRRRSGGEVSTGSDEAAFAGIEGHHRRS
jgi:hypothetical protein